MNTITRRGMLGMLGSGSISAYAQLSGGSFSSKQLLEFDAVVVGGGVSGLYAAYNLQKKHPSWAIALIEASHRFGGRQYSIKTPGCESVTAEMGAMRFIPATQPLITSTIEDLGLKTKSFGNGNENNLLHLRGKRFRVKDLKSQVKVPYKLQGKEVGNSPGGLMMQAIMGYFPDALKKSEEEWAYVKDNAMINGKYLYEHGFLDLIKAKLSPDAFQFMMQGMGYTSFLANHGAAELFSMLSQDMPDETGYLTVENGFQSISLALLERFKKLGGVVLSNLSLDWVEKYITSPKNNFVLQSSDNLGFVQQHVAKRVVLALPPTPLKTVIARSELLQKAELESKIASVTPIRASKLHMAFEHAWWKDLGLSHGYSKTDQALRQCVYMGAEKDQSGGDRKNSNALLLASYVDGFYSDYWKKYFNHSPEKDVQTTDGLTAVAQHQLSLMHGVKVPKAYWATFMNWDRPLTGGGWHFWKTGVKTSEILPKIQQPIKDQDLYLCNEAFSVQNGWTEGALVSAQKIVDLIN